MGIAQYTSDPVFARLVDERLAARPATEPRPRLTLPAVRTLLDITRAHPGGFLGQPALPAAARRRRDLPRRVLPAGAVLADLARLRQLTSLPMLVKGILHPDDARRAVDTGADGIIVSNHGGRQVDGSVAALDALPGVVGAVAPGACRCSWTAASAAGPTSFKALSLGARAVLVGRPYVYGLALDGDEGVRDVLAPVADLDITMALTGCTALADLTPERLVAAP